MTDPRVVEALAGLPTIAAREFVCKSSTGDALDGTAFRYVVAHDLPSIVRATAALLDDDTLDVVGRVWLERRLAGVSPAALDRLVESIAAPGATYHTYKCEVSALLAPAQEVGSAE